MGTFKQDDIELYRTDITEIPIDKQNTEEPTGINSGTVEVRCFINSYCPFVKTPKQEDTIIFNGRTLNETIIKKFFPDDVAATLTTTQNTEGLHFIPKYVYRNNYLFEFDKEEEKKTLSTVSREIEGIKNTGADEARYKKDQSWVIVPSVFENAIDSESGLSTKKADWSYGNIKADSDAIEDDIINDYNIKYYDQNRHSITHTRVQMPEQITSQNEPGLGVHWKVKKVTEVFEGEDFFIEFHKRAKTSNINNSSKIKFIPFKDLSYAPLDISIDPNNYFVKYGSTDMSVGANASLRAGGDSTKFNLIDQAYYVIEIGTKDFLKNYFIIICERSNPIFVHFLNSSKTQDDNHSLTKRKAVARILSTCPHISGKQLIDADFFRVTVRNHLGALVIEFKGKEIQTLPWIVKREDSIQIGEERHPFQNCCRDRLNDQGEVILDRDNNPEQESFTDSYVTPILEDRSVKLSIPRGKLAIWGGNLLCGFIFGPLQYVSSFIKFAYPPNKQSNTESVYDRQNMDGEQRELRIDPNEITPAIQNFSLPKDADHEIRLTNTELDLNDDTLFLSQDKIAESIRSTSLFTQDAQFYQEYVEKNKQVKVPLAKQIGSFFYGFPLKEINNKDGKTLSRGKEEDYFSQYSTIALIKIHSQESNTTRQEKFSVAIRMQCGDHFFQKGEAFTSRSGKAKYIKNEEDWLLLNCKTPILTHFRLISKENSDPRWEDGTSSLTGYEGLPSNTENSNFIDASEHVMDYSESWSASDFSNMEHTGTVKFLLNDRILNNSSNISEDLKALQNKTFYIEMWAGYKGCNYTQIPGFFKLFTGLCYGGEIEKTYPTETMTCKLYDYNKILQDQKGFNYPFFDGVKDVNAIYEILNMAGFRSGGFFDPGYLLSTHFNNDEGYDKNLSGIDGRRYYVRPYALPSEYNRLEQPSFKFQDGSNYKEAIDKIAKRAGKVFYFDQHGIAHYEEYYDRLINSLKGQVELEEIFSFTSNPFQYPGQIIFNKKDYSYSVQDVHNHIKMFSNTPDRTPLFLDQLNWESIDNPDSEGFIGYLKTFYQEEGMFGSEQAIRNISDVYKTMFRPPIIHKFETYGIPLRSLDIISIDGTITRVTKVSHSIVGSENKWWMNVECERLQPINDGNQDNIN